MWLTLISSVTAHRKLQCWLRHGTPLNPPCLVPANHYQSLLHKSKPQQEGEPAMRAAVARNGAPW